ncbi:MAG: hypothetical protein JWM88_2646 [Verrucomicrobia bacterium]|nr:hypothetical protein [Verrucomicrobiota bacterium]
MNHYCTYFDRGFLIQGLALARSLAVHDPGAVLWVLALDESAADVLRKMGSGIRVVALDALEADDPELIAAKANRSRVEYFFTLSPCWPRWLLRTHPEIGRITYVDADTFFFSSPAAIFEAMDRASASILITAHRFPEWLKHYEQHGVFNVGVESFRNDAMGTACLDDWRRRCLEWCHDRLEEGRYADQKYLDAWPLQWGAALLVLDDPGVNLAPWNWRRHRLDVSREGVVTADGSRLVLFHFARFRPIWGDAWWQSGQLDYGVMPRRLRSAIYGPYWRALRSAREEIRSLHPDFDFPRRPARLGREFWRGLALRAFWGSDWLRVGDGFWAGRLGLGRWSGQSLARLRRIFLRR